MNGILKFLDLLDERVLVLSFMFNLALLTVQVMMRYVFGASLYWSEELVRYIFLWQIWLGTSWAVKEHRHIRIDVLPLALEGKKSKMYLELLVLVIWSGFAIFLAYKGSQLCTMLFNRGQLSPAMRMPMVYAYLSVPVGCAFMTLRLFIEMYKIVTNLNSHQERA